MRRLETCTHISMRVLMQVNRKKSGGEDHISTALLAAVRYTRVRLVVLSQVSESVPSQNLAENPSVDPFRDFHARF